MVTGGDGMTSTLLTVPEVAARLRVSEWTVREWLRRGRLQGLRPGGTKAGWRIDEADLERFLEKAKAS
jgi:excisionase family DNA binding protein